MKDIFVSSGATFSCPDPNLWLVIGFAIGFWFASCIWMAYIVHRNRIAVDGLCDESDEEE